MKLVGVHLIEEAQERHANAARRLAAWTAEVSAGTTVWKSFQDVRARYLRLTELATATYSISAVDDID